MSTVGTSAMVAATSTGGFKDHFSAVASEYANARPEYPDALFAWIASISPTRDLCLGRGLRQRPGQSRAGVAVRSRRRHRSERRADRAGERDRQTSHLQWNRASNPAWPMAASMQSASHRRCTGSTAMRSSPNARACCGPAAFWSPGATRMSRWSPCCPRRTRHCRMKSVPAGRRSARLIDEAYAGFDWPFEPLQAPDFELAAQWTLPRLLGYFSSYSASKRYREATGRDAVAAHAPAFAAAWGEPQPRGRCAGRCSCTRGAKAPDVHRTDRRRRPARATRHAPRRCAPADRRGYAAVRWRATRAKASR